MVLSKTFNIQFTSSHFLFIKISLKIEKFKRQYSLILSLSVSPVVFLLSVTWSPQDTLSEDGLVFTRL